MMRLLSFFVICLLALAPYRALGQDSVSAVADSVRQRPLLTHEILAATADTVQYEDAGTTIALPWADGRYPWVLHEGFNAEVGMSVSASFGKNRRKGVGFGEHLALAYAMPFGKDKRWIGAVGVYAARSDWGSWNQTEAGIAGLLGYRAADWCNLYVYGTYNFVPGGQHYGRYPYDGWYGCYGGPWGNDWISCPYDPYANLRGRIGAAAEFKIGRNANISVAFEHDFYDNSRMPVVPVKPNPQHNPVRNGATEGGNHRVF